MQVRRPALPHLYTCAIDSQARRLRGEMFHAEMPWSAADLQQIAILITLVALAAFGMITRLSYWVGATVRPWRRQRPRRGRVNEAGRTLMNHR